MRLEFRNNVFIASCSFIERNIPREAGFKWNPHARVWYTNSIRVAAGLRDYATPEAENKLSERLINVSPWTAPLPSQSKDFLPHQIPALDFVLTRSASYLALDPGLGKTPIAAVAASALFHYEAGLMACVYVTPPFLVRNVEREFKRWAPDLKVGVLNSKTSEHDHKRVHVLLLPDTFVAQAWTPLVLKEFLGDLPARLLIVDEAHRFKNDTAQRTRELVGTNGVFKLFNRSVCLSGTPMPNRPIELFTVLNAFAPEVIGFREKIDYAKRYCAATYTDMGWDMSGASNLDELRKAMVAPEGPYMLRMTKALLNLPPKIEQVFLLSADMPSKVAPLDQAVSKILDGEDTMRDDLANLSGLDPAALQQVSVYRRVLGEYKAKDVLPFIKSILEETNEAIIVFAYHRQAIDTLATGLKEYQPFIITGDTPQAKRDAQVVEFRDNKARRLFIGNYLAMGVGFPMQRADRVVFVEYSWVPGENQQASDRPHRIGRTETVLVQYVTYAGSLDESVLRTNLNKMKTIENI